MTGARPLYLVGPRSALAARLLDAVGEPCARHLSDADGLAALVREETSPGLVVLSDALPDGERWRALDLVARGQGEWTPAEVRDTADGPRLRTLSVGFDASPDEVRARLRGEEPSPALLELRAVLSEVARNRHDVNNPLTSALAETQLLLLDAEDPELIEVLETIQTQLRRIRDLVAATQHLRGRAE